MNDRLKEIKELTFQARVDPNRVGALSLWLDLADIDWLITTIEQQAREIERLQQWINDLQSHMYINCVYCGHRYGPDPGTPVAMADVLKQHIEQCPKHPLSHMKARTGAAERQLAECRERVANAWDHLVMIVENDSSLDQETRNRLESICAALRPAEKGAETGK